MLCLDVNECADLLRLDRVVLLQRVFCAHVGSCRWHCVIHVRVVICSTLDRSKGSTTCSLQDRLKRSRSAQANVRAGQALDVEQKHAQACTLAHTITEVGTSSMVAAQIMAILQKWHSSMVAVHPSALSRPIIAASDIINEPVETWWRVEDRHWGSD